MNNWLENEKEGKRKEGEQRREEGKEAEDDRLRDRQTEESSTTPEVPQPERTEVLNDCGPMPQVTAPPPGRRRHRLKTGQSDFRGNRNRRRETVRGKTTKHHHWASDRGKKDSVNNWEREKEREMNLLTRVIAHKKSIPSFAFIDRKNDVEEEATAFKKKKKINQVS